MLDVSPRTVYRDLAVLESVNPNLSESAGRWSLVDKPPSVQPASIPVATNDGLPSPLDHGPPRRVTIALDESGIRRWGGFPFGPNLQRRAEGSILTTEFDAPSIDRVAAWILESRGSVAPADSSTRNAVESMVLAYIAKRLGPAEENDSN